MAKKSRALAIRKADVPEDNPHEWVPGKIGIDDELIVDHVVRQVKNIGLLRNDGFVEILQKGMRYQAKTVAIFGDLSTLVDKNMPIDVTPVGSIAIRREVDEEATYDDWRERRTETARRVIDDGIARLRQFFFNHFWDQKMWEQLTYNRSYEILLNAGEALLPAVLGDAPEGEREALIAMALAKCFAEDIVKAEMIDINVVPLPSAAGKPGVPAVRQRKMTDEIHRILSRFLEAAEGKWIKCYEDTLPLSISWMLKLEKEVAGGNTALIKDLRGLVGPCEEAISGDDDDWYANGKVNEVMAKILAKHFPATIISKLTPATEIFLRSYQKDGGGTNNENSIYKFAIKIKK